MFPVAFILRRLVQLPISLLVISFLVFLLVHLAPGDPIVLMLGNTAVPEVEERLRHFYGLDQPLWRQYVTWIGTLLQGDFGTSIRTGEPVARMVLDRLPATLTLATSSLVCAVIIAIPIGILAAVRQNTVFDYASMGMAMLALSVPTFVSGVLLVLTFGVIWQVFPISGLPRLWDDPIRALPHFVLPTIALGASRAAVFARLLRASMLDVLNKDYIRVARSKGLTERRVLWVHALKNSMFPLITVVAIQYAHLLGGAVVTEAIFVIPGVGSLLLRAIVQRDFPVIQGIALSTALIFIVANLLADLLYTIIDPRVR